jgi:hypothetical protein
MPSQLNRRAVFAAVSAFVLALAVAYALSSAGEASVPAGPPGEPAQPIDVASGVAGQTTLGDAEALPALVRKPKPKKQKPQSVDTSTPSTSSTPTVSSPPPVSSPPVVSSPAPSTPVSPPVRFEDSG